MPDRIVVVVSRVLLLSLLVSCAPQSATLTQPEPTHFPTSTLVTLTQPEPTHSPTPSVTPPQPEPIATSTSRPQVSELKPCPEWVPEQQQGQVGYEGVLPGVTTDDEILEQFGEPVSQTPQSNGSNWSYRGLAPTFVIANGIVTDMYVTFGELPDGSDEGESILQILEQYGCPDVIYAVDLTEHKSGDFGATLLVYLNNGVEFIVYSFPLNLRDSVPDRIRGVDYFPPSSLGEYLSQNPSLKYPEIAAQVTWDEAISD